MNLLRKNSEDERAGVSHSGYHSLHPIYPCGKVALHIYLLVHITIIPIGQLSVTHQQKQKTEEQEQAR